MTSRGGAVLGAAAFVVLVAIAACGGSQRAPETVMQARWDRRLTAPTLFGDTGITDTIAHGALHRAFLVRQGPWAIHVLDIDRSACWSAIAVKGTAAAAGRARTSALVATAAAPASEVAGGVNADFFLFDPPGVPQGAHVSDGMVVTGPGARPVFAILDDGRAWIGILAARGVAVSASDSFPIVSWNRVSPTGVSWIDARYGPTVDTLAGSVRVALSSPRGSVVMIDSGSLETRIPASGGVLVLGPRSPAAMKERFRLVAQSRGQFDVTVQLDPVMPREAVGGFPVLVRDSAEVPGLDSAGAPTFAPVRHPRTIVGVAANGRRVLLITVDGRQPGYSAGATNRESARIALDLGATQAINLDGGGSTTMVVARRRGDSTVFEVANRPSDPQGERPVGNALVITRQRRPPSC